MWLLRAASSLAFLFLIVFTIPLTFDVGGKDCGLAFSLALSCYYFLFSVLRLVTPDHGSRFRLALVQLVRYTQWLAILALMIWSMNKFAVDSNNAAKSWVERTFKPQLSQDSSLKLWLLGRGGVVESVALHGWEKLLLWSAPLFQFLEGFCSLLVIQACGQITRWLVNREGGDSWMIGLLGLSSAILSSSLYFLWRITTFPELNTTDALLIGATITCVVILGSWGIFNGRGNPVESSLLFAYITLCIYQIFTDYQPSNPKTEATPPVQPEYPPLPPVIMATYSTLLHYLSSLPTAIHASFNFVFAVVMTITPSVIISLAYRVFVMYAAARIIPAIRESGARALSEEPSLDDDDDAGRFLGFLSWFSPSILIAVYTSLLMQHFTTVNGNGNMGAQGEWWFMGVGGGDAGGNLYRWLNVVFVQLIYAVELYMSRDEVIVPHWKVD
ncbi:uncharacterized protein PV09_09029 [Verruconis gallopava]|uniref:ER membrane protein n=1 Tax=Verruconis gallopava TaxID=253628 RepID=A0A0D2AJX9_9PEZI|nr:uncharacterized protein PV09_09029 [Verruconis gallopava]KIV99258.1 hypothetical protein PV09_09029 [Verruconis gallopava]